MPKTKRSRKSTKKYVPYVKGFHQPTQKQRSEALGKYLKTSEPEYDASKEFFTQIPRCTSINDWLAQYKEEGQTYEEYLFQTPWLSHRKLKGMKLTFVSSGINLPEKYPDGKIYILPLGDFDSAVSPQFDAMIEYAQSFFCLPVKQLPPVKLEENAGNIFWITERSPNGSPSKEKLGSRYEAKSDRRQLKVQDILHKLQAYLPDDGLCLIALTMSDLYQAKSDLFVAGMTQGRNSVAVFSLLRYDPNLTFSEEFWYKIKHSQKYTGKERQKMILLRSCKLLVHETSHLLGIGHCIYYSCCMNGSGHLDEDFAQSMYLCPVDLRKLQSLCGFDVCTRYKGLHKFFDTHGMKEEAEWMAKRITFIQEQKKM